MHNLSLAVLLSAAIALSACGGGGADSTSETTVNTTTKGQELKDLKAALDAGALTQEEYEVERQKILDED